MTALLTAATAFFTAPFVLGMAFVLTVVGAWTFSVERRWRRPKRNPYLAPWDRAERRRREAGR